MIKEQTDSGSMCSSNIFRTILEKTFKIKINDTQLGVLINYISNDPNNNNLVKWNDFFKKFSEIE
jgi:hypothetical protein